MHLFFFPFAGPVVCFVNGSLSHEDGRLAVPGAAGSSSALYHPNLRRNCLVENHMVHVGHVESLLTNTGRNQHVVFAVSEILKDLHLFTLRQTEIILISTGLTQGEQMQIL